MLLTEGTSRGELTQWWGFLEVVLQARLLIHLWNNESGALWRSCSLFSLHLHTLLVILVLVLLPLLRNLRIRTWRCAFLLAVWVGSEPEVVFLSPGEWVLESVVYYWLPAAVGTFLQKKEIIDGPSCMDCN